MHTVEYATCPPSFINVWQKIFERNPALNLRNANDYHIPTAKTEAFKKIPLHCQMSGTSLTTKSNSNLTALPSKKL